MVLETLYVKNNSRDFLNLVNKLKADKDAKINALLSVRAPKPSVNK